MMLKIIEKNINIKLVGAIFLGLLVIFAGAWLAFTKGNFRLSDITGYVPDNAPAGDSASIAQSDANENAKNSDNTKKPAPSPASNLTGLPLSLLAGFSISIFADNLPGARVIEFDRAGNIYLSRTGEGRITFIEIKDGKKVSQKDIFSGLDGPHGLAFDPEKPEILYFAEENRISRVDAGKLLAGEKVNPEKIADLPFGAGHSTRTLIFGRDGRLYVSIGSSCNVCNEADNRRAKIFSMNKDGSDFREYARGLRNSVFMALHPKTGEIYATEMGRDLLGDNLPPDEINIIKDKGNYGWPICYGKNIHDTVFDKNTYIRNPCAEPFETPSLIDLPAHSAPLGLAFIPEEGFGNDLAGNLLVAFHGSWNRSRKTGYKVVMIKINEKGEGQIEDFITGWLTVKEEVLGRPVDIKIGPDKAIFITDDNRGVIYRVEKI
ncbi:MAG: PQQ-dependent sugar dehydrogenase [Patescibacteria group bacterium]|jgi:glucose/arabinose dehydrogenase